MKDNKSVLLVRAGRFLLCGCAVLLSFSLATAQTPTPTATPQPTVSPAPTNSSTSTTSSGSAVPAPIDIATVPARLARARALAAAFNLPAAISELESARNATPDKDVRATTGTVLVSLYLEQGNYRAAQLLLEESFKARGERGAVSQSAYYSTVGQSLRGLREHLDRYRNYGINITDTALPPDTIADLDKMRGLLEAIVNQAIFILNENNGNADAAALFEEAASVRANLARDKVDRVHWTRMMTDARQNMSAQNRNGKNNNRSTRNVYGFVNPGSEAALIASTDESPDNSSATGANRTQPATNTASTAASPQPKPPVVAPSVAIPSPAPTPTPEIVKTAATSNEPANVAVGAPNAGDSNKNNSGAAPAPTPSTSRPVPTEPVALGSLIAQATQRVSPVYPTIAKNSRIVGTVTVYLELDEKGEVAEVQRSEGPALLRRAAEDAARRWKFRPAKIDGRSVRSSGFVTFNFSL